MARPASKIEIHLGTSPFPVCRKALNLFITPKNGSNHRQTKTVQQAAKRRTPTLLLLIAIVQLYLLRISACRILLFAVKKTLLPRTPPHVALQTRSQKNTTLTSFHTASITSSSTNIARSSALPPLSLP